MEFKAGTDPISSHLVRVVNDKTALVKIPNINDITNGTKRFSCSFPATNDTGPITIAAQYVHVASKFVSRGIHTVAKTLAIFKILLRTLAKTLRFKHTLSGSENGLGHDWTKNKGE